jgi:hypothetical protein
MEFKRYPITPLAAGVLFFGMMIATTGALGYQVKFRMGIAQYQADICGEAGATVESKEAERQVSRSVSGPDPEGTLDDLDEKCMRVADIIPPLHSAR